MKHNFDVQVAIHSTTYINAGYNKEHAKLVMKALLVAVTPFSAIKSKLLIWQEH